MKKILRIALLTSATYCIVVMILSIIYMFAPPVSTLMLARWVTLQKVVYHPVPLSRISPHLQRSVIRAEDSRFCDHYGIDWSSMKQTIEAAATKGHTRGASTIPMQVTKNLFLWPQQSYIRKSIEIPMTIGLSALWSKARVMEIYLSIAEWGPGIFGAEAAAQTYFHKHASELSQTEAALLASALPNPKRRNPGHPSHFHARYAANLAKWSNSNIDTSCLH